MMDACGRALAARFAPAHAYRVLTAEVSGIAPALVTALHLGVPAVYARRERPVTMADPVVTAVAPSHTKHRGTALIVAPAYLPPGARVLMIDLPRPGQTIWAWHAWRRPRVPRSWASGC